MYSQVLNELTNLKHKQNLQKKVCKKLFLNKVLNLYNQNEILRLLEQNFKYKVQHEKKFKKVLKQLKKKQKKNKIEVFIIYFFIYILIFKIIGEFLNWFDN